MEKPLYVTDVQQHKQAIALLWAHSLILEMILEFRFKKNQPETLKKKKKEEKFKGTCFFTLCVTYRFFASKSSRGYVKT